jgi:hypothetical protein
MTFVAGLLGWLASQTGLLGLLPHAAQVGVQALAGLLTVLGIRTAAPASPIAAVLDRLGSHWKTITGALAWAIGTLAGSPDVGVLGPGLAHWLQVAGEVLTALGLYHAAARAPGGPALAADRSPLLGR